MVKDVLGEHTYFISLPRLNRLQYNSMCHYQVIGNHLGSEVQSAVCRLRGLEVPGSIRVHDIPIDQNETN